MEGFHTLSELSLITSFIMHVCREALATTTGLAPSTHAGRDLLRSFFGFSALHGGCRAAIDAESRAGHEVG
jgi:hypothetical protein